MTLDIRQPDFWKLDKLDKELRRVYDICAGCRRCLPLCPSFRVMFDRLDTDAVDGDVDKLPAADVKEVVDLCYQCKLCYNHCPYTPPHRWQIDFPRLMLRARSAEAREKGVSLQDRFLGNTELVGKLGTAAAPLSNWVTGLKINRRLMEATVGIHRDRELPEFHRETFSKDLQGHQTVSGENGRAILFTTCFVEYSEAHTARAALEVLEHSGVAVEGGYDACCGAPFLHGGDLPSARKNAAKVVAGLIERVRAGVPVVVPGPTCSYQLKNEYPELLGTDEAREVAAATQDLGEFIFKLAAAKKLKRDFPKKLGRIAYHLPCHLKAQNIGFRSMQLLGLVSDDVRLIDACSGVDGTWGMKARGWEASQKIAGRLVMEIESSAPERVATDCPLAALRILERTGQHAVHPVVLLHEAYGLGDVK